MLHVKFLAQVIELMKKLIVFLLMFIVGCHDSNDSIGPIILAPTDAPSISDLQTSPAMLELNEGGGSKQVTISINFIDNNGDITTVRYQDSRGEDITSPLGGVAGVTSGTVTFSYMVDTGTASSINYKIWLIDGSGNESNKLAGSIWVSW